MRFPCDNNVHQGNKNPYHITWITPCIYRRNIGCHSIGDEITSCMKKPLRELTNYKPENYHGKRFVFHQATNFSFTARKSLGIIYSLTRYIQNIWIILGTVQLNVYVPSLYLIGEWLSLFSYHECSIWIIAYRGSLTVLRLWLAEWVCLHFHRFNALRPFYISFYLHLSCVFGVKTETHLLNFLVIAKMDSSSIVNLLKLSGAPNGNFRKISVRKTIWDLKFWEHLL